MTALSQQTRERGATETSTRDADGRSFSHESSRSMRDQQEPIQAGTYSPNNYSSQETSRIPRASDGALSRLPHMRLFAHEASKYQDNTECCSVCFGRLMEGVALVKLPCSHIFHITCAVEWLSRTCTCPECRYELPTRDRAFEKGRVQRMKGRKTFTCECSPSSNHPCFLDKSLLIETSSIGKDKNQRPGHCTRLLDDTICRPTTSA